MSAAGGETNLAATLIKYGQDLASKATLTELELRTRTKRPSGSGENLPDDSLNQLTLRHAAPWLFKR
jgi:hypothetical protein